MAPANGERERARDQSNGASERGASPGVRGRIFRPLLTRELTTRSVLWPHHGIPVGLRGPGAGAEQGEKQREDDATSPFHLRDN